jgi:heme exporter protein A
VRGERVLFKDLNFQLSAGEALSVEGSNGAGKTSLLRIVAGFLAPAAGAISVTQGADRVSDNEERGKLFGWLGHLDAAKSQLTPAEVLRDYARLYGGNTDTEMALTRVGLAGLADLWCQYLSAGQKKRLALARLLLSARTIWLLDEPLASLDEKGKRLAAELIKEHNAAGGIAIAATHEPLGLTCTQLKLGDREP